MAGKNCPKCSKTCGPRTKKCECGHDFYNCEKPKEVGAWVYDRPKDMPKIRRPSPLPANRKLTKSEIDEYISYNGIGSAIIYVPHIKINDKKLAKMWEKASNIMEDILDYVYD